MHSDWLFNLRIVRAIHFSGRKSNKQNGFLVSYRIRRRNFRTFLLTQRKQQNLAGEYLQERFHCREVKGETDTTICFQLQFYKNLAG